MNEFKIITSEEEWNRELQNYRNDWYHTWHYHQMARNSGEGQPMLFVLSCSSGHIALPLLLREIGDEGQHKDLTSVYGYPGFLLSNLSAYSLYDEFLKQLQIWSTDNGVVSIFTRLNSLLCDAKELEHCFFSGETVVVDLSLDAAEQKKRYRKNYRNLIRRLEKEGYTAGWSNSAESLEEFKYIYNETMASLGAGDYYFFNDKYYQELLASKEFDVRIYSVWKNEVRVCAGMFIFCDDIVQYHLSGTLQEYKNEAPTRLLIDKAREDATELGYKHLHLGGGVGGERDSLFNFKYGFSKESIDFSVLKMVTNTKVYKQLSNLCELSDIPDSGYFPLYRKVN
ncbi:GNAT family N-acetyltransferase [Pseudoalteromonas luteoviolacea]|uniref:GNAT family N-acetyltransferase n=1 Tax=Pseudoalteromonas luteoviolacea TaxID=43657 RepID=UPI001B35F9D0|nr:GNAT family N-acetyltransferase [Pseudoalteromonas luteoviolacea]MBQ4812034.1 GNAT family N-acetyltransferase [Pseudoalteromonas luteoviolacea]